MQAEAKLSLHERHVHNAQMTWPEGRLKLARSGFCDQHPDIRLRRKKWLGFKEKVILKTCPKCDEEHGLKMAGYRLQLEAARQTLSNQNIDNGEPSAVATHVGQAQWPGPLTVRWPSLPQDDFLCSQSGPLQKQTEAADPEPLDDRAGGRFGLMVASRTQKQSASCKDLAPNVNLPQRCLPERSSSCRADLSGIPEDESDDNNNDKEEEYRVNIGEEDVRYGEEIGKPKSMSRMDVPLNSRLRQPTAVCSSCRQFQMPSEDSSERTLRPTCSFGDAPVERPHHKSLEEAMKDLKHRQGPSTSAEQENQQPPVPLSSNIAQTTDASPPNDINTGGEDGRKPVAKPTSKPPPKPKNDEMERVKDQERRRKKVGAIVMPGNSETLQNMTEFAKYAMSSATDVKTQCLGEAPPEPPNPVKDCVNYLKWKVKHAHEAQQALHELQALCQSSEENQTAVVYGDGLRTVLDTMKTFSAHAGVQEEACWVLGTLAYENEDHKALIAEAGGITAIVTSMDTLAAHAGFQETACEVVTSLTDGHLLNTIAVSESGGVAAIVDAMERHATIGSVQEKGCSALGDLALGAPTLIAESGGIAAIFAAMMEHKFDAELQGSACGALGNLACENDTAKFLIAQAGGIGFILAALHNHDQDAGVQELACFALQNVAHNSPDNKDMMVKCGALTAMLALLTNKAERTVMEAACDTIIILIQHHDIAKDALVGLGGIPALVSVLENRNLDATVQQAACRVIANLSHNHDQNKKLIAEQGGITAILACMIDRADNPRVVESACKALTCLTVNNENKIVLAEACGIEYIVAGMGNHIDHAGIQESGCRALMNLAFCDAIRELITESGGVAAILSAMYNHKDSAIIQEKACGALRELAVSDANEIVIAGSGGIDAVLKAMEKHKGSPSLFRNACGALRNLSFHDETVRLKIIDSIGFGSMFAEIERFMTGEDNSSDSSHGSSASF